MRKKQENLFPWQSEQLYPAARSTLEKISLESKDYSSLKIHITALCALCDNYHNSTVSNEICFPV